MPEEQNLILWTPDEDPERPGPMQIGAWIAGFALVALWGVQATPWPEGFEVTAKVEHLAEEGDSIDALFVGSSNVFRSFIPEVIDTRLDAAGLPLTTFNLGGPSVFSFETDYLLRRVLELDSLDLDYVFIEPGDWDAEPKSQYELDNMLSNRSVYFHDLRQTRNLLSSIAESDADLRHKWELASANVRACLWKMVSYGQGVRILQDLRGVPAWHPMSHEEIAAGRGYQGIEDDRNEDVVRRRRALLVDDPQGYAEKVELVRQDNRKPLGDFARRALEEQVSLIRDAGARPIFIAAPSGAAMPQALRLEEEGEVPVLAFIDPDRYPEYYAFESRFDPNHLSRQAAIRFSAAFADRLAELLSAPDSTPASED